MLKLLVCDDEKWIREGICHAIDWESLGITTILEARDGRRAIELVRGEKPDLVITDIKMPFFGGLEMIEAIKTEVDPSCIIVISGFSSFEYARTALQLGIADYLLKPVDEGLLLAAMRKCLDALAQKKKLAHQQQSTLLYYFSKWLENEKIEEERIAEILKLLQIETSGATEVLAVTCRLLPESPTGAALPQLRRETLTVGKFSVPWLLMRKSATDFVYLFFSAQPSEASTLPLDWISTCGLWGEGGDRTVGVGRWAPWRQAWITFRQSKFAAEYRLLYPEAVLHFYADVSLRKEKKLEFLSAFQQFRPMIFLMNQDVAQYQEWLQTAFEEMASHSDVLSAQELLDFFSKLTNSAGAAWEIFDSPDYQIYCDSIALTWRRESLFALMEKLPRYMPDNKNTGIRRHFLRAITFIGNNYSRPLTMQEVADELGLNASYFSKMFGECAGEPFLKYLARLRMETAKALLSESRDKIYEVAEKIGYSDYRIFSKNFKEYVGMSPVEYRDSCN